MKRQFVRKIRALTQRISAVTYICGAVVVGMSLPVAAQQQDWWFDIEVIVFERQHDTPLAEQFDSESETPSGYAYDLLSRALYPDVRSVLRTFPICPNDELPSVEAIIEEYRAFIASQQAATDDTLTQETPEEVTPLPNLVEDEDVENTEEPSETVLAPPLSPLTRLIEAQQAYIDKLPPLAEVTWQRPYDCLTPSDVLATDHFVFLNNIDLLPRANQMLQSPTGANWQRSYQPHLLDDDQRLLQEFADDIQRQRNQRVLLHTAWRQEVLFGRDVAQSMRLIAGQDYNAPLYQRWELEQQLAELERQQEQEQNRSANTETTQDEDPFFTDLFAAINGPVNPNIVDEILAEQTDPVAQAVHLIKPLWQLDGEFKVFLQYIGGVPYLHVDNDLRFRRPSQYNDFGEAVAFDNIEMKQLRRVISQQIHYFDHPLFGVIVQIRRYQRPSLLDDSLGETNE
ncbi:CsiV family protein [Alteromonas sp. ASW11-36]|uniref:CsiV family protein n=1 Tax=Alteromonas arenosi TaxID=3055817 RepID=A0ABT7SY29_9ALTE|nr:CsiV family protein [Alteromonas sp. ASW11-36]MDM7861102.1 CsiV family protein [Alteromonas sp. ASW11-36]